MSGQLKKLEIYLGVQLVERNTRSVFLTPIGEEIVKTARTILADAASIENMAATFSDPMCGSLNIGLIPTIAPYLLPMIVQPINEAYPQLEIILHEVQTDVMLEKLNEGILDAGILAVPIEMKGLGEIILYTEPFYVAANNQHLFATKSSIKIEDLKDETLLLLEEGHCLRDQALDICSKTGACENQNFRATSLETLRQMVAANVGITLIPQMAMKHNDGLVYIPFGKNKPTRKIGLVWRKKSSRIKALTEIVKSIQGSFES